MAFTTTNLFGGSVLVSGTDIGGKDGEIVLRSEPWAAIVKFKAQQAADKEFNEGVEEFFAPIVEAAEKRDAAVADAEKWNLVTLGEDVEGHESETVELDEDGVLLRLLDETDGSMLRWVGDRLVAVVS